MERPSPPPRPDLVDPQWCHFKVKVFEDDRWLVRDRYAYGHPVDRSIIDKSLYRYHPNFEITVKHPDEREPSGWLLLLPLSWAIVWIYLCNQ